MPAGYRRDQFLSMVVTAATRTVISFGMAQATKPEAIDVFR